MHFRILASINVNSATVVEMEVDMGSWDFRHHAVYFLITTLLSIHVTRQVLLMAANPKSGLSIT